jgi:L-threonylcarbamoyladenylate synthase
MMPVQRVVMFEGSYDAHIRLAAETLREDALVLLPFETVYGAAAALNRPTALGHLRQLMEHGEGGEASSGPQRAFIPHLAKPADAMQFLGELSEFEQRCIRKLWPGPVALVFDVPAERRGAVAASFGLEEADLYTDQTITLRCPDHPVAIDVIRTLGTPVAAVKAGSNSSADGREMAIELEGKVDLILDAGPPKYSKPSTIVRVRKDSYEIIRVGIYDQRIIERLLRTTILFVCSGNTCRSPMAEAITRHMLAEKLHVPPDDLDKKGLQVVSAGAMAMPGSRAAGPAIDVVREMGGDLTRHRSRMLSVELIHQADMIFTMSQNHARAVTALVPAAADKVATLDPRGDIEDPIGGDLSLYHQVAGELKSLIEKRLLEKVLLS